MWKRCSRVLASIMESLVVNKGKQIEWKNISNNISYILKELSQKRHYWIIHIRTSLSQSTQMSLINIVALTSVKTMNQLHFLVKDFQKHNWITRQKIRNLSLSSNVSNNSEESFLDTKWTYSLTTKTWYTRQQLAHLRE